MRTEGLRRALVPVSLVLTLVLSITFIPTPVLAPAVISYPVGTIDVVQGETLTLSHRLEWNDPDNPGTYVVGIYWDYFGNDAWHFTVVENRAFFDTDGDNLPDPSVAPIEATLGTSDNGTRFSMGVSATTPDPRDGEFIVEITLRARGPDDTPHKAGDHVIEYSPIIVAELAPAMKTPAPITVRVVPPPPGQPTLFSPADGTNTNNNTPTFEWTNGSNADNHRLLVDNDPDFSLPEIDNTVLVPDNTFTPTALPDENYSWKVIARNAAGDNESSIWTFIIDTTPPAAPTLVWPADGENINDNIPNLDWDAVSEISLPVTYDVWVDNDPDFSPPIITATEITDENYQVMTKLDEGVYYWRVRATDNAGYVGENSQRSFRVDITAPTAPTLLEPTDGTVTTDSTPTFRWTAVTDVSMPVTYDLQVDNDNTFSSPEENITGLTENTYTPTTALADENYSWRIRAVDNAGNTGDWSTSWTLLIGVPRGVDVSISPSYQSDLPGETLNYTVIVTNEGALEDTYSLTVSDNASPSWDPTILNNSLTIPAGENRATALNVTIPSNVALGTEDNITVTATGTGVENSATCIARAGLVIYPIHDAYVWQREKDTNYNTDNLKIGVEADGSIKTWLRFDLSDIPFGHRVESARLRLYFYGSVDGGAPGGIAAHFSSDDSWTEGAITWNNQPSFSEATSDSIPQFTDIGWRSLDLTQDVRRELDDDKKVSWCLKSPEGGDGYNIAHSKEYEDNLYRPYLEIVYVPFYGVSITSISPPENSARPGENVTFTVTVKNMGAFEDNYVLTVSDNLWPTTISPTELKFIASEASGTATLSVTVPENALGSTEDDITVTATSVGDPTESDSDACIARAATARGVEVLVSPSEDNGVPGTTLSYTVIVRNTGNVADNHVLTVSDNVGWSLSLSENRFENVAPDQDRTATLNVTIPGDAAHCTRDNITVTATGTEVENSASCIAHAEIVRGVEVSILPGHKSGVPGATLSYTVTVTNTGNAADNYNLTKSDNAGWGLTLSLSSLTVPAGDSRATMLSITIPSGAEHGERDNIRVVVASMEVSASASCEAEASILRRVEVSISPGSGSGPPGTSLTYTVTVRNAGLMDDTYTLGAVGAAGWSVNIEPTSLTLAASTSDNATLTVTIPEDAENGTSMTVYVRVTSEGDPTLIETDTCRTIVTGVPEGPKVELPIPLAISVVLVGAAIIVPTYLLRGRPKKAARRRVLRDVSLGPRY